MYFGNNAPKPSNDMKNDFELPEEDSGLGKRHFKINYAPESNEYFIQDLGDGSGTFCRIERKMVRIVIATI